MGPKAKTGKPKNEKVYYGVGRVLKPNHDFSVTDHESIAKNRLEIG